MAFVSATQATSNPNVNGAFSLPVSKNVTAGNTLIALISVQSANLTPLSSWLTSITDNAAGGSNTYAPTIGTAGYFVAASPDPHQASWQSYCLTLKNTMTPLTVTGNWTSTDTVDFASIFICEYSIANATFDVVGALTVQENVATTTDLVSSGTAAVAANDTVIGITLDFSSTGFVAGTGFTMNYTDNTPASWGCESLTQGSGATRGATFTASTSSNSFFTGMFAFKSGINCPHTLSLMGVGCSISLSGLELPMLIGGAAWKAAKAVKDNKIITRRGLLMPRRSSVIKSQ